MAKSVTTRPADPARPQVRASQTTVEGDPDYVPPPVVNLQNVVKVGHRADQIAAAAARQAEATVEALRTSIVEDTHRGQPGPTEAATERSREDTVELIKLQLAHARMKPTPREEVALREAASHEQNQALIAEEMRWSITNQAYSG